MLLGLPTSGFVLRNADFAQQSTLWSAFFQDNYRVNPKLTLNLGIRYELEGPVTERYNRSVRGFDFNSISPLNAQVSANYAAKPIPELSPDRFRLVGGLLYAGTNGQPRELWSRDLNNVMPRIGVAYQIGARTVIRGGYGVYYAPLGVQRVNVNQAGYSQTTPLVPSTDNGMTFIATLANPYPNGIRMPRGSAGGLMTYAGKDVTFFNEHPQATYQQRWQIGFQRELPSRVLLEATYIGNFGRSLEVEQDLRPLPTEYLSRSPFRDVTAINYLSAAVPNPFYPLLPDTGLSGTTVARAYLLSNPSYAQFTSASTTGYGGYSLFNGLSVRVERRFDRGFTLNGAYMWSKNMEASSRLNGGLSPLEYVISDQDRPHHAVISGIFELPFGKGKRWANSRAVLDKFAGGWQIQGIYTAQGGQAFGFGNALFIGDVHDITLPAGQRTVEQWFNVNAGFDRASARQLARNYRLMPSRFSDVRGMGTNQWDLSAMKNTTFHERYTAQFRLEFLNAMNHARFRNPNATPTSSSFGRVTAQWGYNRRIQFGMKFLF